MSDATCSVDGCDRAIAARGWCQTHWGRWRRLGDVRADQPIRERRAPVPPETSCEIAGCTKPVHARGMCIGHRARVARTGNASEDVPLKIRRKPTGLICSVEGCDRAELSRTWCSSHYWRWHRHGSPLADIPVRQAPPPGDDCVTPACDRARFARGLCRAHYKHHRLTGPIGLQPAPTAEEVAARIEAERKYQRDFKADEYRRDPEKMAARCREWRKANPERARLFDAKKMRRRRSRPKLPITADQMAAKIAYWGNACWICRGPNEAIDHVKPLSKGGWHVLANLRPICNYCNSRKGAKWPFPLTAAAALEAFAAAPFNPRRGRAKR